MEYSWESRVEMLKPIKTKSLACHSMRGHVQGVISGFCRYVSGFSSKVVILVYVGIPDHHVCSTKSKLRKVIWKKTYWQKNRDEYLWSFENSFHFHLVEHTKKAKPRIILSQTTSGIFDQWKEHSRNLERSHSGSCAFYISLNLCSIAHRF